VRRKKRLTSEAIARAALSLIDREGLTALSMRRVVADLQVDPMTLYRTVPDRDGMIREVTRLLLDEIDTDERPGETWIDTMHRMAFSYREMALRHPRAFPLIAHASTVEEPLLTRARRLIDLVTRAGLPESLLRDVLLMDDAFTTGFLLIETSAICRTMDADQSSPGTGKDEALSHLMSGMITREAFARGLDILYEGLKATFARETPASPLVASPADEASPPAPDPPASS
jgi:AcrR family transcriptional regulator